MADLREFELLSVDDEESQSFVHHEIKTTPLISRDALNYGEGNTQRGLLGSVLTVHAKSLPRKPQDPRIYMNLDAPSSGLVCGVQGSGKSHTVACIMESAMMVDERIGTLPAPLATIVFHYDEENGHRPCEAAFLSELKDDAGPAIAEVIVLVSPSNLNARKQVYKGLKHVQVLPLRIAEGDLNAARMLHLMGADNLEVMPLYLNTALSILRELGSDNFTYGGFNEKLKGSKFNRGQKAMLQQRLNLLNSFLKDTEGDISSFFKQGRLVIVDLSDPFVNSTTAAMLFDICLGLFVEWKTSSGKLIVLDEAHKYLINSDANQFTKSICSIIRQQRHLAARVVVATQEPTVVPPSILDLLSWVVCHRFSSPSWTSHLSGHLCIKNFEQDVGWEPRNFDWSEQVMTLGTGQALLYSPASLFSSIQGNASVLGAGYAIIKTRARLTRDGGESLLATEFRPGYPFDIVENALVTMEPPHSSSLDTALVEPRAVLENPSQAPLAASNATSNVPTEFCTLLSTITGLAPAPGTFISFTQLGASLGQGYKLSGYPRLKLFVNAAQEQGLVTTRYGNAGDEVALNT